MTVQLYALLWAVFLVCFVLVKFSFIIPDAFQYLGKFLVYDVYARIFKNQAYKLVIVPLKSLDCHSAFTRNFTITLMSLNHMPTTFGEGKESLLHLRSGEERRIQEYRLQILTGVYEDLLDEADSSYLWIDIQNIGLGYYSHNLFMRIKPFREEIVKKFLLAHTVLSDNEREFIKNYNNHHAAHGNNSGDNHIAHGTTVSQKLQNAQEAV